MDEYIRRRRNTVAEFVATRPLFRTCWEGKRLRGAPHHIFWWEQEFDLDLQEAMSPPGSDGSTAAVESSESWEEGSGG